MKIKRISIENFDYFLQHKITMTIPDWLCKKNPKISNINPLYEKESDETH